MSKKSILFVCSHNSAQSQIAEGLINALYSDEFIAHSAGIYPSSVNPYIIKVMAEIGIDISKHYSKSIDDFRGMEFDYVITLCNDAKDFLFSSNARICLHKSFQDPSEYINTKEIMLSAFRQTRDNIINWLNETFGSKTVSSNKKFWHINSFV